MTGTLPDNTFKGLREVLIAVGTRDAHRLVQAYQTLDLLLPGAETELLERASQRVFESMWGKSTAQMKEMHQEDAREFVDEFGDLLYEMPFQIPENFISLGRCVSILSGMCTGLDPKFNVWTSLAPYAGKLVESDGGSKWQTLLDELGKMLQLILALPGKTDSLISRMEQGRLEVRTPSLTREVQRLERSQRKTAGAVVFGAFLLSAVQVYLAGQMVLAAGSRSGGFVGAALGFAWTLIRLSNFR